MEYWSTVRIRLADEIPLRLHFAFHKMVEDDIENLLAKEIIGSGEPEKIRDILEENLKTTMKRRDLLKSIAMLRESKSTFSKVIGNVAKMVGKILSGNNGIKCFYIETSSFHDFLIFLSLKTCLFFNHTPMKLVFIILTCKAKISGFQVFHSLEEGKEALTTRSGKSLSSSCTWRWMILVHSKITTMTMFSGLGIFLLATLLVCCPIKGATSASITEEPITTNVENQTKWTMHSDLSQVTPQISNETGRKHGSFQICAICTCCRGPKHLCLPSPCCYAVNYNIPNRPFGFFLFTLKPYNCFGCHF